MLSLPMICPSIEMQTFVDIVVPIVFIMMAYNCESPLQRMTIAFLCYAYGYINRGKERE